ncbi:Thiol:disulfide interchange protein DsbE [Pseudomonas syringae pv. actinidiae]|nr:Thiol:disulfide interchange protein DsbE [Pseudomonas syringae pv. actinidiae]
MACRVEHPLLTRLAQQGVLIYGVNYKDVNADAIKWLAEFHDPYLLNIRDEDGSLGLNLGVYGAPETFLIDRQGIIRYKHVGVIDEAVWHEKLAARYQALLEEGGHEALLERDFAQPVAVRRRPRGHRRLHLS